MTELQRAFHRREAMLLQASKQRVDAVRLAAAPGSEDARIWSAVQFAVCARLHDVTFMLNRDAMERAQAAQTAQEGPQRPQEASC